MSLYDILKKQRDCQGGTLAELWDRWLNNLPLPLPKGFLCLHCEGNLREILLCLDEGDHRLPPEIVLPGHFEKWYHHEYPLLLFEYP